MESAITTKGRITIRKAIRKHLGLKSGDRVKFFIHPDVSVVLLPKRSVKPRPRPVSIDEMSEAAAAGAAAERCFADDDYLGSIPATPTQDTAAERAVASGGLVHRF